MVNAAAGRRASNPCFALVLLGAAYACHSMDRQILSVVVEPIKHAFGVSDARMGLIGFAYAVAFSLACLPVGWLIDRVRRRATLMGGLLIAWSALTLLCGLVTGYPGLVMARMGVGAAEAGGQPLAVSLLADFFAPARRSTAIGIFYFGVAVGIIASFMLGGWMAATHGWRAAFLLAGMPGLVLGIVIALSLREPVRGVHEAEAAPAMGPAAFARLVSQSRPLLHVAAGMTLTSLTITAMWLWAVSLMVRVHHAPLAIAGAVVAGGAVASAIGTVVCGRLADRIARGDTRRLLLVPIVATLACVPLGAGLAYAPTLGWAFVMLFVTAFALSAFQGPCFATVMTLVPPGARGSAGAALQMVINLLGSGLGPLLTGALSDAFGGPASIRPALATTMLINAWASFHLWRGYRALAGGAA